MTKEELKDKYSAFIAEISEIMGLGKPIDILKLCATTDLFFQPLEKRIEELENENKTISRKANEAIADKLIITAKYNEILNSLNQENDKLQKENAELKEKCNSLQELVTYYQNNFCQE